MALRKPETDAATAAPETDTKASIVSNIPPFEDEDGDTATVTRTTEAPAATTGAAVAVRKETALAVRPTLDKNTMLRGLQNAISVEDLVAIGAGTFPRITASRGGFVVDKNKRNLGKKARIEVLSWNYIYYVTTGEENNPEADKLFQISYDSEVLKDGRNINEYVEWLKKEGYNKASKKQYAELYVNLLGYQEVRDDMIKKVDVPPEEQAMYQVSLSPKSVGQWMKWLLEGSLRKARGISDDTVVTMVQEEATNGNNTYALAHFATKW